MYNYIMYDSFCTNNITNEIWDKHILQTHTSKITNQAVASKLACILSFSLALRVYGSRRHNMVNTASMKLVEAFHSNT